MEESRLWSTREGRIYENGAFHPEPRTAVREQIWHLTVNGQEAGSFSCSPIQMEDAVCGFLYLGGVIDAADEVEILEMDTETGEIRASVRRLSRPQTEPVPRTVLKAEQVFSLISRLENQRGRGVHSCALVQGEQMIFRQDVSRGAAVDKAAGACLRQRIPTEQSVLVFSGRVPESIVRKCQRMGCRIILACSGPTDLACEEAARAGITIAGSAGPGRFCVYSCPDSIG